MKKLFSIIIFSFLLLAGFNYAHAESQVISNQHNDYSFQGSGYGTLDCQSFNAGSGFAFTAFSVYSNVGYSQTPRFYLSTSFNGGGTVLASTTCPVFGSNVFVKCSLNTPVNLTASTTYYACLDSYAKTSANGNYYYGGSLYQGASITALDWSFIIWGNTGTCGNSIIEAGETCDTNTQSCTTTPWGYAGTQSCNGTCNWNTCTSSSTCGDSIVAGSETCDNNSQNCTYHGYNGNQTCSSTCANWNDCIPSAVSTCATSSGYIELINFAGQETQTSTGTKNITGTYNISFILYIYIFSLLFLILIIIFLFKRE